MRGEGGQGPYTQVEAEALEAPARSGEQSEVGSVESGGEVGALVGHHQLQTTGHTLFLGISL